MVDGVVHCSLVARGSLLIVEGGEAAVTCAASVADAVASVEPIERALPGKPYAILPLV